MGYGFKHLPPPILARRNAEFYLTIKAIKARDDNAWLDNWALACFGVI